MTTALILNIALAAAVLGGIVGLIAWSIGTQRGDRRHIFVRRARRPQLARPPRVLGGTPIGDRA